MSTPTAPGNGFSGGLAFILAASGSAVGLGNIWKFPYIVGEYGGGAFVLFYLLCVLLLGAPVMMAEIFIGKRGQGGPVNSFANLGSRSAARLRWVGYAFIVFNFLALAVYAVVGGWTLYYVAIAFTGEMATMDHASATATFDGLMNSPAALIICQLVFMGATTFVVARGVSSGIERFSNVIMPAFLILLFSLTIYALLATDTGWQSIEFMFRPDVSKLTPIAMAEALGHAFTSLSIGLGAMLIYGQYMPAPPHGAPTTRVVSAVVAIDTIVALCAGLMIFAIIFNMGGEAASGPGLLFVSLPVALGELFGGQVVAVFWFGAVFFAALASGVALMEVGVSHFVSRGYNRVRVSLASATVITLVGFSVVWSLGDGSDWELLAGMNIFEALEFITNDLGGPLGGFAILMVVGWMVRRVDYRAHLPELSELAFNVIHFITRYIAPLLVLAVLAFFVVVG